MFFANVIITIVKSIGLSWAGRVYRLINFVNHGRILTLESRNSSNILATRFYQFNELNTYEDLVVVSIYIYDISTV